MPTTGDVRLDGQEAVAETGVEQATENFQNKDAKSEADFGAGLAETLKSMKLDQLVKALGLELGDMAPVLAGYSLSDIVVAGEGIWYLVQAFANKDMQRGLKGGLKVGLAAVPGLPAAGFSPMLDQLLPNKEELSQPKPAEAVI